MVSVKSRASTLQQGKCNKLLLRIEQNFHSIIIPWPQIKLTVKQTQTIFKILKVKNKVTDFPFFIKLLFFALESKKYRKTIYSDREIYFSWSLKIPSASNVSILGF